MLQPILYWIAAIAPLRLAIVSRPRGDEDLSEEIAGLAAIGVDTLVSLLEPSEVRDLGLRMESLCCEEHGLSFVGFPIADRSVPTSTRSFVALVHALAGQLTSGVAVAVHCRAGIGRSGLLAASLLISLGRSPADALAATSKARGLAVPDTPDQEAWLFSHTRLLQSGV